MGFFDKIKDIMTDDTDDFDEYYDNSESFVKPPRRREREERETVPEREERTEHSSRRQKSDKVVNIHTTAQLQVVLVKPEKFSDARDVADHLLERKTVVLNLETATAENKRRIIDFLVGVAYANGGDLKPVANLTYIITPYNVGFVGEDIVGELENNGVVI